MVRSAIFTLLLSLAAVVAYLGYRMILRPPDPQISESQKTQAVMPTQELGSLPEFSLADLTGSMRSIQSWPENALVINFWATWCAPCLREIPLLKEFQEQHVDYPVQVVGIAIDTLRQFKILRLIWNSITRFLSGNQIP